jgi:hypothetical protein
MQTFNNGPTIHKAINNLNLLVPAMAIIKLLTDRVENVWMLQMPVQVIKPMYNNINAVQEVISDGN